MRVPQIFLGYEGLEDYSLHLFIKKSISWRWLSSLRFFHLKSFKNESGQFPKRCFSLNALVFPNNVIMFALSDQTILTALALVLGKKTCGLCFLKI